MRGSSKDKRPFLQLELSATDDADYDHLQTALAEIISQDPSVRVKKQPHRKLFILEGRAKADLQSIYDRLRDEYHLAVNVGLLDVVFLETIRKQAEGEGKYIRQSGGKGNYGHCKLRIEPSVPGKGYEFVNEIKGGVGPSEYINSIDQGIQLAMEMGILAGFPVVDVKVTLRDGSYHEADSNEMAFKLAGAAAFKEAAKRASPVQLEPMMAVEIRVPEELSAAIRSEIYRHRGRVESEAAASLFTEIKAVVPLSDLLASASSTLVEFPMEFSGYEAVQDNDSADENGAGVTANKPNDPKPGSRSATARWPPEAE